MDNNSQLAVQSSAIGFNPFNREQALVLKEWATDLAYSDLVPEMYQMKETDPAKVPMAERKAVSNSLIALNMSLRMGADVLMVMQNLVIVSGRPSFSAKFLTALVNTSGEYETLDYKMTNKGKIGKIKVPFIVWKILPGQNQKSKVTEYKEVDYSDLDNLAMVAFTKKKGTDKELVSSEVSILMAILEGWYDKNGSKWPNMPEKMLKYRAASFWVSEFAPEKAMGMRTTEEEEDIQRTEDIPYEDVTMKEAVKNTIASAANKVPFNMGNDPVENTNEAEKISDKLKDPENDKPVDTLAKVAQENAAREEEAEKAKAAQAEDKTPPVTKKADAGVQPAFGFPPKA